MPIAVEKLFLLSPTINEMTKICRVANITVSLLKKKYRYQEKKFLIEGKRFCREALIKEQPIEAAFVSRRRFYQTVNGHCWKNILRLQKDSPPGYDACRHLQ